MFGKDRKIKKFIKRALSNGKSREEIKEILLKIGWKENQLEPIFNDIEKKKKDEIEITIPLYKKGPVEAEETVNEKPIGIKQRLDEISETLDIITQKKKAEEKLKKKNFKLPFSVKGKLKKLAIQSKVQVMLLQRTRNIQPVIGTIRDGMLLVGDNIYNGSVDSTWLWRGKFPTHIVPEWDLQPLSPAGIDSMRGKIKPLNPTELYDDTIKNQRSAEPQKIIIRSIEAKENQMLKGKANVKAIIITIVITIIIAAILFGGKII